MGESQGSEAGGDLRLVADPILCLLSWRPVIPQPIRLNDQPSSGQRKSTRNPFTRCCVVGVAASPRRTSRRNRRSSSESVRVKVRRSRTRPECGKPSRRGARPISVRSVSGSSSPSLSAVVYGRLERLRSKRDARSIRVRAGRVTGIRSRLARSASLQITVAGEFEYPFAGGSWLRATETSMPTADSVLPPGRVLLREDPTSPRRCDGSVRPDRRTSELPADPPATCVSLGRPTAKTPRQSR